MSGYTNSQTWEAWLESLEVLWNNTSGIFLLSVLGSLAIILATWTMRSHHPHQHQETRQQCVSERKEDIEPQHTEREGETESVKQPLGPVKRQILEETVKTTMTEQQRNAEREAQSQQLAAIFKMMQEQEEKFGETTIDDIKDQMKLYCG